MKFKFVFIPLMIFLCSLLKQVNAQVKIEIQVKDEQSKYLPFSTVTLYPLGKESEKRIQFADDNGFTHFEFASTGTYVSLIENVSYSKQEDTLLVVKSNDLFVIHLFKGNKIDEIVIHEKKPFLIQDDDKTVVDVSVLTESSSNGFEVIEKVPGLFVDQDGIIYLNGPTPGKILINGRDLKLSAADVVTILKSLPSNAIEKVELLRTPSAKYDASSSGGIVNVVLKKGVKLGWSGNVNTNFKTGKYANGSLGFGLNYNKNKTSHSFNANINRGNDFDRMVTNKYLTNDTFLLNDLYQSGPSNQYYINYGIAQQNTEHVSWNYDTRFSMTDGLQTDRVYNQLMHNLDIPITQSFRNLSASNVHSWNMNHDANFQLLLDSIGSELSIGVQYNYLNNEIAQQFNNEQLFGNEFGRGTQLLDRHFISLQSDLVRKFKRNISLELGLLIHYMKFNTNSEYHLDRNQEWLIDSLRSNQYDYHEWISAGYVQASKKWNDLVLKVGVRGEWTQMLGGLSTSTPDLKVVSRGDIFPYIYLSQPMFELFGMEIKGTLLYRKSVSRPGYQQLNPSRVYKDMFSYETGNAHLLPQFTHTAEFNITAMQYPVFAAGYNYTNNLISTVYYQEADNRTMMYKTFDNVGENKELYLRGSVGIPPGGVYFFIVGGQYNYNIYDGVYLEEKIDYKSNTWLFYTYHQLKLGDKSTFVLNGFFKPRGAMQFLEMDNFGALNLSVNRMFFNKKMTLNISWSDVFYTKKVHFKVNAGGVKAHGTRYSDSKRWGISLRYNFGVKGKKAPNEVMNKINMDEF